MVGSSPSSPITMTFLRKKNLRGICLGAPLWGGRALGGSPEHMDKLEESGYKCVPEDQHNANNTGEPRGDGHHLTWTAVQR